MRHPVVFLSTVLTTAYKKHLYYRIIQCILVPYKNFLGYDKGENGGFVINEEQARIVRRIFGMFLQGRSPNVIARTLMDEGIKTAAGRERWYPTTIVHILENEKYKGCALLQKGYIEDFLTKKYKKNSGEVQQYYVEGGHERCPYVNTICTHGRSLMVYI